MRRKIKLFFFTALLLAAFSGGCGNREESAEYYDITAETEQLPDTTKEIDTSDMLEYVYLGSQFLGEEKIQLWGERKLEGGSVYLHKEDGTRELLMENASNWYMGTCKWWLDNEGRCFVMKAQKIIQVDTAGKLTVDTSKSPVEDIEGVIIKCEEDSAQQYIAMCQLADGRIIVLVQGENHYKLSELNLNTGRLEDIQNIPQEAQVAQLIAPNANGLVLLSSNGIWSFGLDGSAADCLISFDGTSYTLPIDTGQRNKQDFRLSEDGRAELLWSDATAEFLTLDQISGERDVLVLRSSFPSTWLKEQVIAFNTESDQYRVIIEEAGTSDWIAFMERTNLDLGAGKGADLICSDAVSNVYSLLEKGVFTDLAPFMESSGIKESDYFPATFSAWKYQEKQYGINYKAEIEGLWVDKAVVGNDPLSGIEDLIDRLLVYEGNAVFRNYTPAAKVLRSFLANSESLCGMVDFENGTCDFGGPLFEKMLEAAKRFGYDGTQITDTAATGAMEYLSFYCFPDNEFLAESGRVSAGYFFDDGIRPLMKDNMIAINASSGQKDGAWEFIKFLLADEAQSDFCVDKDSASFYTFFPVSIKIFDESCERHSEETYSARNPLLSNDKIINIITGLTQVRRQELRTALENAESAPLLTKPLLQIIEEEAEAYFSGARNLDEVRTLIENRVQLYLNEHN